MEKIIEKREVCIAYELIHNEVTEDYTIKVYFENPKPNYAFSSAVLENVSKIIEEAQEILDKLVILCALPCELHEIAEDLKV